MEIDADSKAKVYKQILIPLVVAVIGLIFLFAGLLIGSKYLCQCKPVGLYLNNPVVQEDNHDGGSALSTPTPVFYPQSQQIGPVRDPDTGETYAFEISVNNANWFNEDGFKKPREGNTFVILDVTIRNVGFDVARHISNYDFDILDANGVVRKADLFGEMQNCYMEMFDLMAGGEISGCLGYEVPDEGKLEFVYAPYQYGNLEPGRYISILIRD